MRVQLLIRDKEYREALTEMIAGTDIDIFVEIESDSSKDGSSVILTDIRPEEIEEDVLKRIAGRTLFLTSIRTSENRRKERSEPPLHFIFKYSTTADILAELALVHHEWTGYSGTVSPSSRTFAVISETDQLSSERCRILARQIIYRKGGSVIIVPLGYINDYDPGTANPRGWFTRLMYLIDEGREYPAESFTSKDSYGVSYLMLPPGLNPVAGLSGEYLSELLLSIGCKFDALILDIGSTLRKENIDIASGSDKILYFGSGRRIADIGKILGGPPDSKLTIISVSPDKDESVSIDDFVLKTFEE